MLMEERGCIVDKYAKVPGLDLNIWFRNDCEFPVKFLPLFYTHKTHYMKKNIAIMVIIKNPSRKIRQT